MAHLAVMSDPLFSDASTTTTASEIPLMSRFRSGKCSGSGGAPGPSSLTNAPSLQILAANSLCSAGCLTFPGGITVAFSGTPPGNVSIGSNPFRNPSSGSLVKSPNAAVIVIQGNSKVTIAGTP